MLSTSKSCRTLTTLIFRMLHFETVVRKSTIMQPIVLKQFDIFTNYIDRELFKVKLSPRMSEEINMCICNKLLQIYVTIIYY